MNHILLLSICQFLEQLTNVLFDYSGGKGTNPGGTRVSNYFLFPVFLDLDGTRAPRTGGQVHRGTGSTTLPGVKSHLTSLYSTREVSLAYIFGRPIQVGTVGP